MLTEEQSNGTLNNGNWNNWKTKYPPVSIETPQTNVLTAFLLLQLIEKLLL